MTRRSRIAAVVVTHNRLAELRKTVDALLREPLDHVVIVDNASRDGTADAIRALRDDRIVLLSLTENRGGAGGFAAGMTYCARRLDPDWTVLMDDDARPMEGAIARFRALRPGAAAVAAAAFLPDGTVCEMNRPFRNPFRDHRAFLKTLVRGRRGFHLGDAQYRSDRVQDVDGASFVGFFVSRRAVDCIGFPDRRLFIYGDDLDYCLRLRAAGERIEFAPGVRFTHDCGTFPHGAAAYRPIWKVYYNYRNGLLAYRKASGRLFPVLVPIVLVKGTLLSRRYGRQAPLFLRFLGLAVLDGLRGRTTRPHAEILQTAGEPERAFAPSAAPGDAGPPRRALPGDRPGR